VKNFEGRDLKILHNFGIVKRKTNPLGNPKSQIQNDGMVWCCAVLCLFFLFYFSMGRRKMRVGLCVWESVSVGKRQQRKTVTAFLEWESHAFLFNFVFVVFFLICFNFFTFGSLD